MRTKLVFCSFLVSLAALLMFAEEKKPGSQPEKLFTGYDIAVIDIGTSGASSSPVYAPVITLKNMGQKTINRTLQMKYKTNGFELTSGELVTVVLAPGQTYVWRGGCSTKTWRSLGISWKRSSIRTIKCSMTIGRTTP